MRIGSPITGYGQESRNRAARQRIPNRVWTDEDGVEHVEVNLLILSQIYLLILTPFVIIILNALLRSKTFHGRFFLEINMENERREEAKFKFRRTYCFSVILFLCYHHLRSKFGSQVNFYIRGPHGHGKVFSEMFKGPSDSDWKFTYLIVEIRAPSPAQLILESYIPSYNANK